MNIIRNGTRRFLCLLIAVSVGISWGLPGTVLAAENPAGVALDSIMSIPSFPDAELVNSASISSDNTTVTLVPFEANAQGAIWSKADYRFDLRENFRIVFRVNFGNSDGQEAGEGLFFLLQGSQNFRPYSYGGASLGALGENWYGGAWGIENSFGIEIDLRENKAAGGNFDYYVNSGTYHGHHVAYLWPGEVSTYTDERTIPWFDYIRTVQHYNTQITSFLADGNDYKMEVEWNASAGVLQYTFNQEETVYVSGLREKIGTDRVYWGFTGATENSYTSQRIVVESLEGIPGAAQPRVFHTVVNEEILEDDSVCPGETVRFVWQPIMDESLAVPRKMTLGVDLAAEYQYLEGTLALTDSLGKKIPLADSLWDGQELRLEINAADEFDEYPFVSFHAKLSEAAVNGLEPAHRFETTYDNVRLLPVYLSRETGVLTNPQISSNNPEGMEVLENFPDFVVSGEWTDMGFSKRWIRFVLNGEYLLQVISIDEMKTEDTWEYNGLAPFLDLGENTLIVEIWNGVGVADFFAISIVSRHQPLVEWIDDSLPVTGILGKSVSVTIRWMDKDSESVEFYYRTMSVETQLAGRAANDTPGEWTESTFSVSTDGMVLGSKQIGIVVRDFEGNTSGTLFLFVDLEGDLFFSQPPSKMTVPGGVAPSGKTEVYKLSDPLISVRDTRDPGGEWKISVCLENEFREQAAEVFYRDSNGAETAIGTEPVTLFEFVTADGDDVVWSHEGEAGFYIRVFPGHYSGIYTATFNWMLEDA